MDFTAFGDGPQAETLGRTLDQISDKRLTRKVLRLFNQAFTHLNQIDEMPDESTWMFCRLCWLNHYKTVLEQHAQRKSAGGDGPPWPKSVCTLVLNLLKIRWKQRL